MSKTTSLQWFFAFMLVGTCGRFQIQKLAIGSAPEISGLRPLAIMERPMSDTVEFKYPLENVRYADKFDPLEIVRFIDGQKVFGLKASALKAKIEAGEIPAPIPLSDNGRALPGQVRCQFPSTSSPIKFSSTQHRLPTNITTSHCSQKRPTC